MNRLVLLCFVALSLLAASCSPSSPEFDNTGAELTPTSSTAAPSTSSSTTTTTPDALAFTDQGPLTLRVSVPRLDFVNPSSVDETDAAQVLVTDLLTDGLTIRDPVSGAVGPGIATSWSSSNDGLTWTFNLGDATFGDGSAITADDVVWSLRNVATAGIGSLSGPNLWAVEGWTAAGDIDPDDLPANDNPSITVESVGIVPGITAVDDKTVQFTLTERFEPLPDVLAGVAFGVWPSSPPADDELPISSAIDFSPTSLWADGVRLEAASEVDGEISTIELFVDPTNSMLEVGETDLSVAVDPAEPLGDLRGTTVQRSADAFFAMNSTIAPFDDPMIRQAIVHAVNRDAIRDEFFPHAGVMQSFIPQQVLGGVPDACGDRCEFDPEQATLLVEASSSSDVAFTVDYFSDEVADEDANAGQAGPEQRLAEALVEQLRVVGLDATAQAHSTAEFGAKAARNELGLFRFGSVSTSLTAEADIGAMFHTAGSDNLTGTSIERFDALIDQARQEPDADDRADLYQQAEFVLFGEAVVLPLVEFRHHLAHGPTLVGANLEADGSLDLNSIEFETLEQGTE